MIDCVWHMTELKEFFEVSFKTGYCEYELQV